MKNGSSKSSKTPTVQASDIATTKALKHREAPVRPTKGAHLHALEPIPPEAAADPLGYAEKAIEALAPAAVKELEWGLYFGSEDTRRNNAKDLLAMKGITTKPKDAAPMQQAVVINMGVPVTASGAPVLPYSNAPALDTVNAPVTVTETPKKGTP